MSRATIAVAPNQSNTCPANTPPDPFNAGGGGKRQPFFLAPTPNPQAPATEAQKACLTCTHHCISHANRNMPAGLDAYHDQCHAWLAAFGANQKITELNRLFLYSPEAHHWGSGGVLCLRERWAIHGRNCPNEAGTIQGKAVVECFVALFFGHSRSVPTPR